MNWVIGILYVLMALCVIIACMEPWISEWLKLEDEEDIFELRGTYQDLKFHRNDIDEQDEE